MYCIINEVYCTLNTTYCTLMYSFTMYLIIQNLNPTMKFSIFLENIEHSLCNLYYICSFSRSPETLLLLVLRALIFPPRWSLPSVEILRMLSIVVNLCSKATRMSHFQLPHWQNQFGVDSTFSLEGLIYVKDPADVPQVPFHILVMLI